MTVGAHMQSCCAFVLKCTNQFEHMILMKSFRHTFWLCFIVKRDFMHGVNKFSSSNSSSFCSDRQRGVCIHVHNCVVHMCNCAMHLWQTGTERGECMCIIVWCTCVIVQSTYGRQAQRERRMHVCQTDIACIWHAERGEDVCSCAKHTWLVCYKKTNAALKFIQQKSGMSILVLQPSTSQILTI